MSPYRGCIWQAKADLDNAIKDYTEAIRLVPDSADAYINRGEVFHHKGDLANAIKDCTEAIRLDPNNADAYANRGYIQQMKGDFDNAIKDYREAIKLDPNSELVYNDLAWILATCTDARFRDGNKAVEYATKACELCKLERWECLGCLAAAYAEAGDFPNAIKWAEKSLEPAPEEVTQGLKKSLELFQSNKPYRDDPKKSVFQRRFL